MNKKTEERKNVINLWLKICNDYYSEGIDYEQLREVGITLLNKEDGQ